MSIIIKLGVLCVCVVFFIPFVYDFFITEEEKVDDKKIEINSSVLTGYNEGKLSWKMLSNYIWSTKSRYLFYADSVSSGFLYDSNGKIVVESIQAKKLRINTRSNTVSAMEAFEAKLVSREDDDKLDGLHASDDSQDNIHIQSDELRYYSDSKKTYIEKNVSLTKKTFSIHPKYGVEIDNDDNIAYITDGFVVHSDEYEVSGNNMIIYIDDHFSEMDGELVFEKKASMNVNEDLDEQERQLRSESTILTCDYATYTDLEGKRELIVSGNIVLNQKGKIIKGQYGVYDQELDYFELEKELSVELEDMKWLIDRDTQDQLSNADIQNSLNKKTVITGEKIIFDSINKVTKILGNVVIQQPDKTISCDKLLLYDDSSEVECFGNVKVVKTNEDTLYCKYLKINVKKEQFLAKDGVYTEYNLD